MKTRIAALALLTFELLGASGSAFASDSCRPGQYLCNDRCISYWAVCDEPPVPQGFPSFAGKYAVTVTSSSGQTMPGTLVLRTLEKASQSETFEGSLSLEGNSTVMDGPVSGTAACDAESGCRFGLTVKAHPFLAIEATLTNREEMLRGDAAPVLKGSLRLGFQNFEMGFAATKE